MNNYRRKKEMHESMLKRAFDGIYSANRVKSSNPVLIQWDSDRISHIFPSCMTFYFFSIIFCFSFDDTRIDGSGRLACLLAIGISYVHFFWVNYKLKWKDMQKKSIQIDIKTSNRKRFLPVSVICFKLSG